MNKREFYEIAARIARSERNEAMGKARFFRAYFPARAAESVREARECNHQALRADRALLGG